MFVPAIALAGPAFVMARSAEVVIVVLSDARLFVALGSKVALLAVAVFVMMVLLGVSAATWTTSVKVSTPPAGSGPPSAGPESWLKETRLVCAGSGSAKVALWASEGPLFVR